MAGPKTALALFRKVTFAAYHFQIKRVLKERVRKLATRSGDTTLLLPNWSVFELLKVARAALATHIARRDNPHQETMRSIGSYTDADIIAKLSKKVPNSIVPVSSYGVLDFMTDAEVAAAWVPSGFTLTCNRSMRAILSGTPYVLPAATINLYTVDANPANKTFNIYLRAQFGLIRYECRADTPPESVSIMFLGSITTNGAGIVSKSFSTVYRLDTFRLSLQPVGSAIPVASGPIDAPAKFPASWNPL